MNKLLLYLLFFTVLLCPLVADADTKPIYIEYSSSTMLTNGEVTYGKEGGYIIIDLKGNTIKCFEENYVGGIHYVPLFDVFNIQSIEKVQFDNGEGMGFRCVDSRGESSAFVVYDGEVTFITYNGSFKVIFKTK